MAAITNTTVSADLAAGMDIEMVMNFQQEYDRLADVLMEQEAVRLYGQIADAQFSLEDLSSVLGQE